MPSVRDFKSQDLLGAFLDSGFASIDSDYTIGMLYSVLLRLFVVEKLQSIPCNYRHPLKYLLEAAELSQQMTEQKLAYVPPLPALLMYFEDCHFGIPRCTAANRVTLDTRSWPSTRYP